MQIRDDPDLAETTVNGLEITVVPAGSARHRRILRPIKHWALYRDYRDLHDGPSALRSE